MKKIGIMGGTFDPIHTGHLILAETAYEQYDLDQILFMPAGKPPHKRIREGASDEHRIEMIRLAIDNNAHFALSLDDMHPDGYSFTYRMLERLKQENTDTEYYFIMGADSLFDFEQWREPARISAAAHILAAVRDHADRKVMEQEADRLSAKYPGEFSILDSPNVDISSRMLRERVEENRSIRYYVSEAVYDYICSNGIYR